ncbi:hypothetical protein ACLB2K_004865 [Fragaria x ananassa]
MLSRILCKRNTVPVQLINAQEFEYNEIESSVQEASAPRFRFNEIYKKGSFIMDSHRFKILELTVPATGGETDIRDAAHCLRLRIKTDGISMKKGIMELAINYRIYYKLMSSNVTPNTRFLNNPGITTYVLTNRKNNSQQKHVTNWHEVTFLREWNLCPPVKLLESSNASIYEDMGGKISLQFHRNSFANYEEASTSGTKSVYNEESLEEEDSKRPMRMIQARELRELYAQAKTCDSPEELEKIINEISQVQLGKKKRKILPYQAAKEESEPSRASMDTDGERQTPPESGHTVIQNITNNPRKIIREKNIKLPKGQAPTGRYGERSSPKYIPTEPKWGQSVFERGVYLDLDQVGDKRKTIDNWVASLKLTQALVLSKYAYEEAHAYYESTLTGIVHKWYQSFKRSSQWTDWAAKMAQTNSPLDFAVPIYAQFCGDIMGHSEQSKEIAKANIQKLKGHYANECPKQDKRSSKALIAEYDEAIEYANLKGFEVAYFDEENESIYSLEYPSDSETEDTGLRFSLAKRYAIPEEYWEKSPRTVTGVAMEENNIVMDTMARNVLVSLGGGTFTINILWQCDGQTADLLLRNDFLLQQTVIQTTKMIGFEKHKKYYWESRLTDAICVTSKGFTDQYQKSPVKSGDYKPLLKPVLLLQEKLKGHKEILVNKETSSEDSDSEESSEYQISDNESSDGEEEYIREHNLKVYANKVELKKIPTLTEIEKLLKPVISEYRQLYWERDPIYCQLKMHDANAICHVKAIPHYREEDRKEMENQIQELLEKKLIRSSNSPHRAPAFLVRNHAEQLREKARMVIDYRDVNKKTVKDGYHIAQVRVLINRLKGAKIFSKFDSMSGFWQVKMHLDSIALTAFGTPQGHYEWLVMPFGL